MFNRDDPPAEIAGVEDVDMSGQKVLITGSTSGIGRAAAIAMGHLGAHVFVHGRNQEAGEAVVDAIDASAGSASFHTADFIEPAAVEDLAATVRESVDTLDVLCNNAGGIFTNRAETDLGVDKSFHVNHLAPYHVTAELLPVLDEGSRVVTTSSIIHRATTFDIDKLIELSGLSPIAAYARSKLANILFANELAARLSAADRDITSNSFHPGMIPGSELGRALPANAGDLLQLFDITPFTDSVEDGAGTMLYLAASPEVADVTGSYFSRRREARPSGSARDVEHQRELWRLSAEILGIDEPLAEYATIQE
jgi:NAD(P)-dependent dehydrogenase (short-subunit alcohol dehydrogenase family)